MSAGMTERDYLARLCGKASTLADELTKLQSELGTQDETDEEDRMVLVSLLAEAQECMDHWSRFRRARHEARERSRQLSLFALADKALAANKSAGTDEYAPGHCPNCGSELRAANSRGTTVSCSNRACARLYDAATLEQLT